MRSVEKDKSFIHHAATLLPSMTKGEYVCPYGDNTSSGTLYDEWSELKFDRNSAGIVFVYEAGQRFSRERFNLRPTGLLRFPTRGGQDWAAPIYSERPIIFSKTDLPPLPSLADKGYPDAVEKRLDWLHLGFKHTFSFNLFEAIRNFRESLEGSPQRNVFEAAKSLTKDSVLFTNANPPEVEGDEVFEFLDRGVGTASDTLLDITLAGIYLYREAMQRSPHIEMITTLVRNSYPAVSKLASVHIDHIEEVPSMLNLSPRGGSYENFRLIQTHKGPGIDVKKEVWAKIQKELDKRPVKGKRAGCMVLFPYKLIPSEFRQNEVKEFVNTLDATLHLFADAIYYEKNIEAV